MRPVVRSAAGFAGLTLVTISICLVFPGTVGTVTPVPLPFSRALGVLQLGTVFAVVCVGFYLLGRLAHGHDTHADER